MSRERSQDLATPRRVRLATRPEKSRVDIAIVMVGVLLLVPPLFGAALDSTRNSRAESELRDGAVAKIEPATRLPDEAFEDGRRWRIYGDGCDTWVIPVSPLSSGFAVEDRPIDAIVRSEATAFENAGWTVARYAPRSDHGTLGFRASRAGYVDVALREEVFGFGLEYVFTDSVCETDTFKLELFRAEVPDF